MSILPDDLVLCDDARGRCGYADLADNLPVCPYATARDTIHLASRKIRLMDVLPFLSPESIASLQLLAYPAVADILPGVENQGRQTS